MSLSQGTLEPEQNFTTAKNWTQSVNYIGTEMKPVYRTNWNYMAVAIVVSLLGVLGVAPLYYGWRDIPKSNIGSFNPIEIAKAFNAPLLDVVESARMSDIIGQVGGERVKYGADASIGGKLHFSRDSGVRQRTGSR
jgi:hypothetical protein